MQRCPPAPSQRAWDARPSGKRRLAGSSTQVIVMVADDLLRRLDEMARQTGQSRIGLIKTGINRVLRDGL